MGSPLIAVSPKEQFLQSLDPQVRKLIIAILTWIAERERELIRQRTIEGIKRAKLQGKHVGRPKIPIDEKKVRGSANIRVSERISALVHINLRLRDMSSVLTLQ